MAKFWEDEERVSHVSGHIRKLIDDVAGEVTQDLIESSFGDESALFLVLHPPSEAYPEPMIRLAGSDVPAISGTGEKLIGLIEDAIETYDASETEPFRLMRDAYYAWLNSKGK